MFIAGDWGTSRARLMLCAPDRVIDQVDGAGVADRAAPAWVRFDALVAGWRAAHGALPSVLCGMVGSTLGWVDAGYVGCPAGAAAVLGGALVFMHDGAPVRILPGLSCAANVLGAPDVLRGEETQIFGALAMLPELARGVQMIVLPGTHTKWVRVEDGQVVSFVTALTGELFALLRDHGTLGRAPEVAGDDAGDGFAAGLARQAALPGVALSHLVFEVRARHLLEGMGRARALAYLSGLLIGADVEEGRGFHPRTPNWGQGSPDPITGDSRDGVWGPLSPAGSRGGAPGLPSPVTLIGAPELTALYDQALALHGISARSLDGAACALAGLRLAAQEGGV